jgi:hypothetical protein
MITPQHLTRSSAGRQGTSLLSDVGGNLSRYSHPRQIQKPDGFLGKHKGKTKRCHHILSSQFTLVIELATCRRNPFLKIRENGSIREKMIKNLN